MERHSSRKRRKSLSFTRILIIVFAGVVFLYSGYQLFSYFIEGYKSNQATSQLANQAITIVTPPDNAPQNTAPIDVDFDILQSQNPDIIAWIYCEGTPINYPVVQGKDNQYYLRRLTDGTRNNSGTIFMDFRNSRDFTDLNSLIYGHNMKNNTMFGSLSEYKNQDYYEEHPEIWLLTKEQAYKIELISGFVTKSDSDSYTLYESADDFKDYIDKAVSKSTFTTNVDLNSIEKIVTLSTCSHEYETARYIVIGSLVPIN